ncbi:hypothetical protein F5984_03770 [Rudanella paleaurantiibacter]|uniref:Uncharacterized protein n=1 Tax=Rudanella paleaurantiibacter TaxID=2614655 RepID=A0A7J5U5L3_9BACT|nr:hypothetical protein [Rudanella paleaurantiibacter]KAB7733066.1 hypothetical protein F5984_03770 [Rudanella paleaurantiibacter]
MKKLHLLFQRLIVSVLWLGIGASCQKDPPEPDYECGIGCCTNVEVFFVNRLEGVPMDKVGSTSMVLKGYNLNEAIFPCLFQPKNEVFDSSPVTYNRTFTSADSIPPPFKFRVWGVLYKDRGFGVFGIPTYWVKFERVERVN